MKGTVRVVLNIPVEEKEWIYNLAQHFHLPIVTVIRQALDEYKEKHCPDLPDRPGKGE